MATVLNGKLELGEHETQVRYVEPLVFTKRIGVATCPHCKQRVYGEFSGFTVALLFVRCPEPSARGRHEIREVYVNFLGYEVPRATPPELASWNLAKGKRFLEGKIEYHD